MTAVAETKPAGRLRRIAALAPLWTSRIYLILFVSQLVGIFGRWMQLVAAQWFLIDEPPSIIALVPTMMSLPIVLFALPAGALADRFDRRRMLVVTQAGLALTATLLAVFSFTSVATPWLVLALVFAMGSLSALNIPPFHAAQAEVLPKEHLVQAATLLAVGANIGRALGPALAGAAILLAGAGGGFAFAALTFGLAWFFAIQTRGLSKRKRSQERLGEALRAGTRYVSHSKSVRNLLFWTVVFVTANAAVWALLPKLATTQLHLGASGYGLLLAALGGGALVGALMMPAFRQRFSSNQVVAIALGVIGLTTAGVTLVPNAWMAAVLLTLLGAAYITFIAQLNGTLNLVLPDWVRARGLSFFLLLFQLALGAASFFWGLLADEIGASRTVTISGGAVVALIVLLRWIKMPAATVPPEAGAAVWTEPELSLDVGEKGRPVTVTTIYSVPRENRDEFLETMASVARARRRTGAFRHELLQDGLCPDRYIEKYVVPSWTEYVRQQAERLSVRDRELERRAHELAEEVGTSRHWFPVR